MAAVVALRIIFCASDRLLNRKSINLKFIFEFREKWTIAIRHRQQSVFLSIPNWFAFIELSFFFRISSFYRRHALVKHAKSVGDMPKWPQFVAGVEIFKYYTKLLVSVKVWTVTARQTFHVSNVCLKQSHQIEFKNQIEFVWIRFSPKYLFWLNPPPHLHWISLYFSCAARIKNSSGLMWGKFPLNLCSITKSQSQKNKKIEVTQISYDLADLWIYWMFLCAFKFVAIRKKISGLFGKQTK